MKLQKTYAFSDAARKVGVESRMLKRWIAQDRGNSGLAAARPSRRELVRALRRRGLPIPENLQPWPRVLVVDDEPDMLKTSAWSIGAALPEALVVTASDGDLALRRLSALKPNLLVTDLRMPGDNDGMALCRRVDDARRLGVRVIVMSADGSEDTRSRAFDAGVSEFLVKPFHPGDLVSAVRRALGPVAVDVLS